MENFIRFNRQEIYTPEMLTQGLELHWGLISFSTRNMVSGLFDGFLYNDLLSTEYLLSEGVSESKINEIHDLTNKIQAALEVELKWANKNKIN